MAQIKSKKNVLVWGTFDLLHEGHIKFLQEAAKLGNLYVITVSDKIVFENKGYFPDNETKIRKKNLENLPFVQGVFVDSISEGLHSINTIKPDIFCTGYDQNTLWEDILKSFFEKNHMNVQLHQLNQYADGVHSKHLRKGRTATH